MSILIKTLVFCLFSTPLLAYGYLNEYLSADGTVIRTSTFVSSDVIATPKRSTSGAISFLLCNDSGTFNGATTLYYQAGSSELLDDLTTAVNTWNAVGSGLSFASPAVDGDQNCANNTGENLISFTNSLPSGVLAYTDITYTVSSGQIQILHTDIKFRISGVKYLTHACETAGAPSGSCTYTGAAYSFLGILTHEMGHALGLAHSMLIDDHPGDGTSNTLASMFPAVGSLAQSIAFEDLTLDDQLSLKNLYPPSGWPDATVGRISGNVYRQPVKAGGQRGAHVVAYDLDNEKSLAGAYTSMSGTLASPDGSYSIVGLPLNTHIAVFVEPVQRTEVHANLVYNAYNTPIAVALQDTSDTSEGYRTFKIEGYPDAAVVDVHQTLDPEVSPAFSHASQLLFSGASLSSTNVNFYVHQSVEPSNDSETTVFSFNNTEAITPSRTFQITLSNPVSLSLFSSPTIHLYASQGGTTYDWSSLVPTFTYTGTSSTVTADLGNYKPSGSYSLQAELIDSTYGTKTTTAVATFSGYSSKGCSLRPTEEGLSALDFSVIAISLLGFLLAFRFLRRA